MIALRFVMDRVCVPIVPPVNVVSFQICRANRTCRACRACGARGTAAAGNITQGYGTWAARAQESFISSTHRNHRQGEPSTLTRRIPSRLLIAAAIILSFVAGASAGGLRRASQPRLDIALDHLSQAHAALDASAAGEVSAKALRHFDRDMARAHEAVDRAIEAIGDAKTVSDWTE